MQGLKSWMPPTPRMTTSPSITNWLRRFFSEIDDSGVTAAPVMAVADQQTDAIAVTGHNQAVTVVFDFFVEPLGGRRDDLAAGQKAGAEKRAAHRRKIGIW